MIGEHDYLGPWIAEVERILKLYKTDPEEAHGREDDLVRNALRLAFVGTDPVVSRVAGEVLKLTEADVKRWYS